MALLGWSSKYSVGVESMDSQHTVLLGLLNDLHEAMIKGQAKQSTGPLLKQLMKYAHDHFSAEEALMTSAAFPGLAQHRVLHLEMIKRVGEFTARHEKGESTLNLQLLNFLRDWLSTHIQNEDKKYGQWIKEHATL